MHTPRFFRGASCVLVIAFAAHSQAALRYRVTVLSNLDGEKYTTATAISDAGHIAGNSGQMGVFWPEPEAPPEMITGQGDNCNQVTGVNSSGIVTGITGEGFAAYRWHSGSDLEVLDGTAICCPRAEGINDDGIIVGRVHFLGSGDHAAVWSADIAVNLGGAPGDAASIALDISNNGQIVGRTWNTAARWVNGQAETLAGLAGNFSFANGVNNRGEIVGEKEASGPQAWSRPFHWFNGKVTELPLLGGFYGFAHAINDDGLIVGMATVSTGIAINRATLWRNGKAIDLNDRTVNLPLNMRLSVAYDINASGMIVGAAENEAFELFGFFLAPLPPADINIDGQVNVSDLLAVISGWGQCAAGVLCDADVVEDGQVNVNDLLAVIGAWGSID